MIANNSFALIIYALENRKTKGVKDGFKKKLKLKVIKQNID